ncbi:hypothetical protein [Fictibacillus terranigra]|uniref:Uncharacterized protein n=1 Tax=Fictibacillus terranigra TaxID=3058424 RepID=A0ABT8E515_9BACL|nr:hypothetical protein [Fictibacillus sp. CENA-BCM004]MDN4073002.1 hypothetical protein [Fictibacillus sp. CENA-BCM004]
MKISFIGDTEDLSQGLDILCQEMNIVRSDDGFPINVKQATGPIEVSCGLGAGKIRFDQKFHFFRALGLWIQEFEKHKEFQLREEPQFTMNGVMLDTSRNAVMKVEGIQTLLRTPENGTKGIKRPDDVYRRYVYGRKISLFRLYARKI